MKPFVHFFPATPTKATHRTRPLSTHPNTNNTPNRGCPPLNTRTPTHRATASRPPQPKVTPKVTAKVKVRVKVRPSWW